MNNGNAERRKPGVERNQSQESERQEPEPEPEPETQTPEPKPDQTKVKSLHAQPGPQKLSSSGQVPISDGRVKSHRSSTPSAPVLVPIIVCLPLLLYLLRALLPPLSLCQQG
ncbi:uncharacterized protein AKAW2_61221A [Aspergillus luchuensis]|uniref:Uncharacterized protein n=1 Tax=Aspergillus kawachii TaxID=1069201 RepID=A0A7R8AEP5_ASPKA|nr:uncharacterized protein AKAW2_61221A [Aspergillus luchuensis]BCS02957.1 hypothetical protein AKAW2_61221A [Aspergillus luchuensis]BCS14605.1 hypothetical protein ALUC_61161A [Aspergillus luchuensis]